MIILDTKINFYHIIIISSNIIIVIVIMIMIMIMIMIVIVSITKCSNIIGC